MAGRRCAVEGLAVSEAGRRVDPAFWRGKRVLLTGHTGFKGGWAALWLEAMGADVFGFALPPATEPSLYALAGLDRRHDARLGDLRSPADVAAAVVAARPQIVLHMAAQPLVRRSFAAPIDTFATNVMGTAHLLETLRGTPGLEAVLVVTTDKVYANAETGRAFAEADPLGGHDPYAASKAAAELVTASYAASFFDTAGIPVATARGGNVIGGGDFSADRIVPDIFRALSAGAPVALRHPQATRPWQHVLDCLAGYLLHLEALASDPGTPRALNFGPDPATPITVAALVEAMQAALGSAHGWTRDADDHPREMTLLSIDPTAARRILGWRDRLPASAAIEATAAWYKALAAGADMRAFTLRQIEDFSR